MTGDNSIFDLQIESRALKLKQEFPASGIKEAGDFSPHDNSLGSSGVRLSSRSSLLVLTMPEYFFEGAEKLLEIWFSTSNDDKLKGGDLRDIERSVKPGIVRMKY